MSPLWMAVIGMLSSVLLLTACSSVTVRYAAASDDVYLAAPTPVDSNRVLAPRISNQIGGSITIITGRIDEIASDVIATGVSTTLESALEEADSHIVLSNTGDEVRVEAAPGANAQDQAQLHVRVPPGTNLPSITIPKGDVAVYGKVGKVTAVITGSGEIKLFGPTGEINLSTGKGSISAELAPGNNNVTARAQEGNIDIVAVTATVNAATTKGNARFIGTLRNDRNNSIVTTGNGNIDLAVPAYLPRQKNVQPYRIYATTSANSIITDYPPTVGDNSTALTICGFVHSKGPYDYHIENTPARRFGRIEVGPAVTTTFFFSGTLAANYYRFDTNWANISFYTPVPQAIHIYTAEQLNQFMAGQASIDPGCKGALSEPDKAAIVVNLKTDRGRIYIRHVFLKTE